MALISTADVRTWLGIAEGDKTPNEKISSIAKAVEDFVDSYTNRQLEAKVYRTDPSFSYLDGNGKPWIMAPQYPISYITEIAIDSDRSFGSGTLLASADFFWYPSGKIVSEGGYFTRGRRNVRLDYIAGFAPVVGGTHNSAVSTYPIPNDIKQTMVEMIVESFKEGITAIHSVQGAEGETKMVNMLTKNSFWRRTLDKYKSFDYMFSGREE
jgi:hypothetical protein